MLKLCTCLCNYIHLSKTLWQKKRFLIISNFFSSETYFTNHQRQKQKSTAVNVLSVKGNITKVFNRGRTVNTFPHYKILDQTKLKAFADDKSIITKMIISVFDRGENIVGKGRNSSFFHNVFKSFLSQTSQKVWEWVKVFFCGQRNNW